MTDKQRWKAYVVIFAAMAFVSAVVTSVAVMTFDNFKCRTPPADDFLAYCRSLGYVDYEHGALYYGLEPKVRESIRAAQVLFLSMQHYSGDMGGIGLLLLPIQIAYSAPWIVGGGLLGWKCWRNRG